MRGRVQKWGNSLALRIPKTVADAAGLGPSTAVDIQWQGGQLVVTPVRTAPVLDDLLGGITPENLHGETGWGEREGREEW